MNIDKFCDLFIKVWLLIIGTCLMILFLIAIFQGAKRMLRDNTPVKAEVSHNE